jgi:cell wall assembly regulator SMI1
MQELTDAESRALEVAGTRLTVTFSRSGIRLAPADGVGEGRSLSWAAVLCAGVDEPSPAAVAEAVRRLVSSVPASPTASAGDLPDILKRLDAWFAQHRQRFHAGLRPGASAAECGALGDCLGHPLPAALHALLSWHNGQDAEVFGGFEESWRLMSADQIATAKVDLDAAGDPVWQTTWIPFLENDRGDCLCLDATGAVRAFWGGQPEAKVEAASLGEWFARFVGDVEAGRYFEDPERGSFMRTASQ